MGLQLLFLPKNIFIKKLKTIKDSITAVNEINTKLKNEEIIQENNLETLNKRVKHKKCIIIIGSFKNKKFAN